MTVFKVVQLSKLDPEVKAWISSQGKPDSNLMNDLLTDFGPTSPTANRKRNPEQKDLHWRIEKVRPELM